MFNGPVPGRKTVGFAQGLRLFRDRTDRQPQVAEEVKPAFPFRTAEKAPPVVRIARVDGRRPGETIGAFITGRGTEPSPGGGEEDAVAVARGDNTPLNTGSFIVVRPRPGTF